MPSPPHYSRQKTLIWRFLRYVTVFVSLRSHLPTLEMERFENDTYSKGFNFGIILKASFYLKSISKRSCVNEAKICLEYVAAFWMNVWKNCFELS